MRLLLAISSRYYQTDDGVWTKTSYDRDMWRELLEVFDGVVVVARVVPLASSMSGLRRADAEGVDFCALPEWATWRLLLRAPQIYKAIGKAVQSCDIALLHSPSFEAAVAFRWLKRLGKPYAVECRGEQVMNASYLRNRGVVLPAIVARCARRVHQRHLRLACGAVYVSNELATKYAMPSLQLCEVVSDLRLPADFFRPPRQFETVPSPLEIVNVANFDAAKGHDVLLRAVARLESLGLKEWRLHLVGTGRLEHKTKELADRLGISDRVVFHGFVAWGDALGSLLDSMHLFVLSSVTEGMPRALLEAMSRGLPAISTRVSGSREVLPDTLLAPVGDPDGLARTIARVARSGESLTSAAEACHVRAQDFRTERLRARKLDFMRGLRRYAEERQSRTER